VAQDDTALVVTIAEVTSGVEYTVGVKIDNKTMISRASL